MAGLPSHASCVVIGCGIVGNSVAYHLGRLGWRDIVLLDKGPLPNPGGSTGHASNFIYLVDHSKEMTALTVESVNQYREMAVFTQSGGIEVARTRERMQELTRRMASARSWGIEPVSMVTPAEVKGLVPYIDESIIVGGFYTPGVGVVDSLRAGTIMRERGQTAGALTVAAKTEVLGIDVEHGRVRRLRTTEGDIEAETVVIACGVWSPRVARMAGTRIPLTPAVHQMIDIGPVPRFAGAKSDIEFPIVRDMDTNMYERQAGGDLEIGSYAHRPILYDPEDIPSLAQAALSPTEFPFTQADFEIQMQHAIESANESGFLGDNILGSGLQFDVEIRRGAGAYICGEETALFNSIEGYRGEPRNKPPFPTQSGLFRQPTAVNNVETLVNVPGILREGGAAYAKLGTENSAGTRLFCLCGHLARPGVYEITMGATLRQLIELAGGVTGSGKMQAVLLGGAAGTFVGLQELDTPLTFEGTRAIGATLGSGVVMLFDDTVDLRRILLRIASFFRHETCGQCVPCRVGVVRQQETLQRLVNARPLGSAAQEIALLREMGQAMRDASICGLGQTASSALESALKRWSLFS